MLFRVIVLSILMLIPLAISAETSANPAQPPTPYLVREINPATYGANPYGMTSIGDTTYFSANDGLHDAELWQSDGTTDGTFMLQDLNLTGSSAPTQFTQLGDRLFFTATGSDGERVLWVSDKTADGTLPFTDLNPNGRDTVTELTLAGNSLFFFANSANGRGLWRSDGTTSGTNLVEITGSNSDYALPQFMQAVNDRVIFTSIDDDYKTLYSSDGQASIMTIAEFEELSLNFVAHENYLYFSAMLTDRWGIWRTDGTAGGTEQVASAFFGFENQVPFNLTVHQGAFYFHSYSPTGQQLYRLDDDVITAIPEGIFEYIHYLESGDETLYLSVREGEGYKLAALQDDAFVELTGPNEFRDVDWLAFSAETLYFSGTDEAYDTELWQVRNGRISQAANIGVSASSYPNFPMLTEQGLMFTANDGIHDSELWIADSNGVRLLRDINALSKSSQPSELIEFQESVYFIALSGLHQGIWKSDGTAAGTVEITTKHRFGRLQNLTQLGDWLYFTQGSELWRTDGTPSGEELAAAFNSDPKWLTAVGNTLFLTARNDDFANVLWKFDGVAAVEVNRNTPNNDGRSPWLLTSGGDLLFYQAYESGGQQSFGLWRSDGTEQGTFSLSQLANGSDGPSNVRSLYFSDGLLYFSAYSAQRRELWVSDGTVAGTRLLPLTHNKGGEEEGSKPAGMQAYEGKVYFSAETTATGRELWVTDGTAEGTELFADLSFAENDTDPSNFTVANGLLYFVGNAGFLGKQIWQTDGTRGNTKLVTEVAWLDSYLGRLTPAGGWLYFNAYTQEHGLELWRTDGDDTQRVSDINPSGDSNPSWLTVVNDKLIFQAEDDAGDQELYAVMLDDSREYNLFLPYLTRDN